ncbi:hypothetical protein [Sphingomonas sp. OK281]|uniref:hypothetical protein n=1 Tax=Sphingomonas sp. OK281 TaxID=1881067 RepID=UPI0008F08FE8|nr:hypothetical protein [Sphingomonas sp. OK281]SFN68371.1 hypothetical protein SAMN05428984_0139 [Sphingomonas sp. OK281]
MPKPHHPDKHAPKPKSKTLGINALSIGAAAIGLGGALLAVFLRSKANPAEHAAPDLALDKHRPGATDRAPDAFRPDPTAVPTKAERESLRPATGPAPSFAADRGSTLG